MTREVALRKEVKRVMQRLVHSDFRVWSLDAFPTSRLPCHFSTFDMKLDYIGQTHIHSS